LSVQTLSDKDEKIITHVLGKEKGEISVLDVLTKFGSLQHFTEMKSQSEDERLVSVAFEVPKELRPFVHTLLPLSGSKYENGDISFSLTGLVPLGPQVDQLVAHLAAVFHCPASAEAIAELKESQAASAEFREAAVVGSFDYTNTHLQNQTQRAKEELGL
jgi:hypothetical protein